MKVANPLGKLGEDIACTYLANLGYTILQRNFQSRFGEIDIIAFDSKEKTIVFAEVKTRTSFLFGTPLEAITYRKLTRMIKTAEYFLLLQHKEDSSWRIDAVSIILTHDGAVKTIEHHKNVSDS